MNPSLPQGEPGLPGPEGESGIKGEAVSNWDLSVCLPVLDKDHCGDSVASKTRSNSCFCISG